jgi:hypothetical protein
MADFGYAGDLCSMYKSSGHPQHTAPFALCHFWATLLCIDMKAAVNRVAAFLVAAIPFLLSACNIQQAHQAREYLRISAQLDSHSVGLASGPCVDLSSSPASTGKRLI